MLERMNGNTLNNQSKNENIPGKLEVAPTKDNMRATRLRWFSNVQQEALRCNSKEKQQFGRYRHFNMDMKT